MEDIEKCKKKKIIKTCWDYCPIIIYIKYYVLAAKSQVQMIIYTLCLLLILMFVSSKTQLAFHTHKQTSPYPSIYLNLTDGENLTVSFKMDTPMKIELMLFGVDGNLIEKQNIEVQAGSTKISKIFNIQKSGQYHIVAKLIPEKEEHMGKMVMSASVNGIVVKYKYAVITDRNVQLVEFTADNKCKLKFHWNGPKANIKLFPPATNLFNQQQKYFISDQNKDFEFDVDKVGTWYARIEPTENYDKGKDGLESGVATLTTLLDHACINYCTDKGPFVVGLAQGTKDVCLCDSKYEDLYWNTNSLKCECLGKSCPGCGNGILESDEECDNYNQEGCVNCKLVPKKVDDKNINEKNRPECGNGKLEEGEECDEASDSCILCKKVESKSIPLCGNKKIEDGEECDDSSQACKFCKKVQAKPLPVCGNKRVEDGEECDETSDSCKQCKKVLMTPICGNKKIEDKQECDDSSQTCKQCKKIQIKSKCGNGVLESGQQCDLPSQGCSNCHLNPGYHCMNSKCTNISTVCGDGIVTKDQQCDNFNKAGCVKCKLASGYYCKITGKCGDGIAVQGQECDNGNKQGCEKCKLVPGYYNVDDKRNKVQTRCGDSIITGNQQCDNGNKEGCKACKEDSGYKCTTKVIQPAKPNLVQQGDDNNSVTLPYKTSECRKK